MSVGFEGVGRMGDVGGDVEDGFDFAAGGAHVEGAGEAGGVFWFLVCHLGVCERERERETESAALAQWSVMLCVLVSLLEILAECVPGLFSRFQAGSMWGTASPISTPSDPSCCMLTEACLQDNSYPRY